MRDGRRALHDGHGRRQRPRPSRSNAPPSRSGEAEEPENAPSPDREEQLQSHLPGVGQEAEPARVQASVRLPGAPKGRQARCVLEADPVPQNERPHSSSATPLTKDPTLFPALPKTVQDCSRTLRTGEPGASPFSLRARVRKPASASSAASPTTPLPPRE